MKTVYVETSILSYLTARPTRDLIAAARQQMTREWWYTRRAHFDLFISPLVEQEIRRGDPDAACRRGEALGGMQTLEIVEDAYELAAALIADSALPAVAKNDATHIALAAVHGMNTCSRGTAAILTMLRPSRSFVLSAPGRATHVRRFAHRKN